MSADRHTRGVLVAGLEGRYDGPVLGMVALYATLSGFVAVLDPHAQETHPQAAKQGR